jgi:hypothetical protein
VAWSRWPREGRWFLCLREGKDRCCLAWIESRDEEVLSDLFLSAVWGGGFSLVLAGCSNPAEAGGDGLFCPWLGLLKLEVGWKEKGRSVLRSAGRRREGQSCGRLEKSKPGGSVWFVFG